MSSKGAKKDSGDRSKLQVVSESKAKKKQRRRRHARNAKK